LVAEGAFTERLLSRLGGNKGFVLDRLVHQEYTSLLLPRAVGYSAGLLDYFFRGTLNVVVSPDQSSPDLPAGLRVNISNNTTGDETGTGTVVGVVEVQEAGQKSWLVSAPLQVEITRQPQAIDLTFSPGQSPPPSPDASLFLTVVYRGPLRSLNGSGEDSDAVAIGRTSLQDLDINPKDSKVACADADPRLMLTATGGIPPYFWETTKGTITVEGVNNETGTFRPPPNTSNFNGIAYWQKASITVGRLWPEPQLTVDCNCIHSALAVPRKCDGLAFGTQPYGNWQSCSDDFTSQPATCNRSPCSIPNCSNFSSPGCGPIIAEGKMWGDPGGPYCGVPYGFTNPNLYLNENPTAGQLVDIRTQQQKDDGCKPCALEMQEEATIAVTDAAGTSVETTIAAE
jgi:hypothetical protein